ncbi:MAG TPA: creatininase family protein [Acidimicrobiales bacterium]|nr:creatininase family protein [Acidimicrobiales bacterium]
MAPPPSRRLAELRAPQVGTLVGSRSILVQPVGAIEQHGPHLPLATDLLIAEACADALVDRHGDELDLWLLPPLAYSKSNEHAWSSGTIWLSASTLLSVLDDLGRCVAMLPTPRAPSPKLVFLNGHGGNSALLNVACRELRLRHGLTTFLAHPGVPPDQGGESAPGEHGMGVHGGHDETSMVLHLRPDLVDLGAARRNVPAALVENRHVRFGGRVSFGWLSDDFGPDGLIGDPTGATAAHGQRLVEGSIATLAEAFREIADFELPTDHDTPVGPSPAPASLEAHRRELEALTGGNRTDPRPDTAPDAP